MASSKLMASSTSRNQDLKRKRSLCTSTSVDFLKLDSTGSKVKVDDDLFGNAYVERNSGLPAESSGSLLNAEIMLLDAAGAVTPLSDNEEEEKAAKPQAGVRKTVDDVWREIVAGKKAEQAPKEEMMTLEDFLVKAGAVDDVPAVEVKEEKFSGGYYPNEKPPSLGMMGLDVGGFGNGRGRGKRSLSLLEPLDKAAQQRQRRMIKNRESAARSRERKQAYQVELESMAVRLEEENERLLKEKAEWTKERLRQLMEKVIPVVEKRKPPRVLRKVRSMQW